MSKKVTIETQVRRLHNAQGVGVQEIAKRLNITTQRVQNIINPNKMAHTTEADRKRRKKKVKSLKAQGYTQPQIADMVGCGVATVQRDLNGRRSRASSKKAPSAKPVQSKRSRQSSRPKTVEFKEYSILWGAFKFVKRG